MLENGLLHARLLFMVTVILAIALTALVILAPWLDGIVGPGWDRLLEVFARDTLVRRTALASAAGLLVTALVFFRPRMSGPKKFQSGPDPGA